MMVTVVYIAQTVIYIVLYSSQIVIFFILESSYSRPTSKPCLQNDYFFGRGFISENVKHFFKTCFFDLFDKFKNFDFVLNFLSPVEEKPFKN